MDDFGYRYGCLEGQEGFWRQKREGEKPVYLGATAPDAIRRNRELDESPLTQ